MDRQVSASGLKTRAFVGGCRASPGGLHLGHVYGCMLGVPRSVPYYFVLSDCLVDGTATPESVSRSAAEALAAGRLLSLNIRIVRESVLRPHLSRLFRRLLTGVSFRLLAEAHPPKAEAKTLGFRGSVDEFLFPIHQACYLIGLGCGVACYNDDNSRYVDLTRKAARRTNAIWGTTINEHLALLAKDPPRLRGWDGRRMAKDYNNALPLVATDIEIQRFAERLVGRASAGEPSFDTRGHGELERLYLSTFGCEPVPMSALGRDRITVLARRLKEWCTAFRALLPEQPDVAALTAAFECEAIERIHQELMSIGIGIEA